MVALTDMVNYTVEDGVAVDAISAGIVSTQFPENGRIAAPTPVACISAATAMQ